MRPSFWAAYRRANFYENLNLTSSSMTKPVMSNPPPRTYPLGTSPAVRATLRLNPRSVNYEFVTATCFAAPCATGLRICGNQCSIVPHLFEACGCLGGPLLHVRAQVVRAWHARRDHCTEFGSGLYVGVVKRVEP